MHVADATIDSGPKPVYVSVPGDRILDTRVGLGLAGAFTDGVPRDLQVTGNVAVAPAGMKTVVPAVATSVVLTATVVGTTQDGFLSVRPKGATGTPQISNVNFASGETVANAVTVDLPVDGGIQIWFDTFPNGGSADVLIDVVGYYEDHSHDDRYFTETEANARFGPRTITKTYSPYEWVVYATLSLGHTNQCVYHMSGTREILLPLDLPVGASVDLVRVGVYSENGTRAGFRMDLRRLVLTDSGPNLGSTPTTIGSVAGGGTGGAEALMVYDIIPTAAETVDAGESLHLEFFGALPTTNRVCSVEVTYTLPSP